MKVLILGATGFIGRNMLQHFLSLGHEVFATYHLRPKYDLGEENAVTWYNCDLRQNSYTLQRVMEGMDIVIHAAATTSGSKDIVNNPAMHVTDNAVMGSYIFKAAVEAKVKHVLFFSCTVMYPSSDVPLTEDAPISISPRYFGVAHTKLYLEKLCEFYASRNTKFTVIRHSNIYGPWDKFDLERSHVFGASITKVLTAKENGNKVTVWGNGEEKRDFLHANDLCRFVEFSICGQTDNYTLYNCGSGRAVSVNELVGRIIAINNLTWTPVHDPEPITIEHDLTAPTIPTSLCLDCTKAAEDLGWEPRVGLDEGIADTISHWKAHCGK